MQLYPRVIMFLELYLDEENRMLFYVRGFTVYFMISAWVIR